MHNAGDRDAEPSIAPVFGYSGPDLRLGPSVPLLPLLLLAACGSPDDTGTTPDPGPEVVARIRGFDVPESVRCDDGGTCYVSNVVGDPADEDGDAFLSRISTEGRRLEWRWAPDLVSGMLSLDAPKGMAIVDGVLHIADITRICAVDLATTTALYPTAVHGAAFLNDLAAGPDGTIYATDTTTGQVFAWDRESDPVPLVEPGTLDQPNGILVREDSLWVTSFGAGELYDLDLEGRLLATFDMPAGRLDGLVLDRENRFLVSSWETSAVYVGRPGDDWTLLADGLPGPADLGYDGATHRLFVPLFEDDEVVVLQLD